MRIVFMDRSAAIPMGQQLLSLPHLKERRTLMQRLRLLNTLGVACALICASNVLVVQNGYACNWYAELIDYTTQKTTHFSIDATPVKMPLVEADKGVDVHCSLDPSEVLSIGILKQQKVDIVCRYPDDQMLTARAITIF